MPCCKMPDYKVNRAEALRYLGYAGQALDAEMEARIDKNIAACECEARPGFVFRSFPIEACERGVRLVGSSLVLEGVDIVRQHEGADPGAVLFDALQAAKARGSDVVICDTAGRLHNKQNLMNELSKLRKIIDREVPDAAKETLLVLDATTGQNGLIQARTFKETAGLTGIVLTKMDGTAKGGIVIAIAQELQTPVKFVGVGEGADDLRPFDAREFLQELF